MLRKIITFLFIILIMLPFLSACTSTYIASSMTKPDENGNTIVVGSKFTSSIFGSSSSPRVWMANIKSPSIKQLEVEVR